MKTMKSIMHIAALTALGLLAAVGIFSADTSDMTVFFAWKAAGFAAAYALCRLYLKWKKTDKWLQRYEEWSLKH
jgi:hypothetical protein